jgi:hypothetical protein
MSSNFQFNEQGLRQLEREVIRKVAPEVQRIFDSVYRTHNGKPVDQVKPVLKLAWERQGGGARISDPELTNLATAISEGTRIKVTT